MFNLEFDMFAHLFRKPSCFIKLTFIFLSRTVTLGDEIETIDVVDDVVDVEFDENVDKIFVDLFDKSKWMRGSEDEDRR
jgi:hypothetical protein